MGQHHELWLTELFNTYLAGLGNAILTLFGLPAAQRPWQNFIVMELLVVAIIMLLAVILRSRLSVEKPGLFQQGYEVVWEFLRDQTEEVIGHNGPKYLNYAATIFTFIVIANLLGVVPGFESPTMFVYVPCGVALVTFVYYNALSFKHQGVLGYLDHLSGGSAVPWPIKPLMVLIEIISHFARPLSLTVRLYANMFAGEMVTIVFLGLVPLAIPAIFMGLHVFVSLLQAYIFTVLTLIYIAGAVTHEEH